MFSGGLRKPAITPVWEDYENVSCSVNRIPNGPNIGLRSGVAPAFGNHLNTLINKGFDSRRAFVRSVGGFSSEDAGVSHVSQVIASKRPPPLDRLDAWADALKLEGAAREHFWNLATLAHLPELVRGRFEQMLRDFEAQKNRGGDRA